MREEADKGVYFRVGSMEAGISATGSRKSNYHCWLYIYDSDKNLIKDHPQKDVFYGKWSKCLPVINKWQTKCKKLKLLPL